ncbi:dipeptide epimerase [Fulvivirga sp. M361]|uniref:mandelate racemase/muconate lactonizing enzyme family protein n=1 Tax=Fulvivirga sp. M361 TaxID=2594266 RepID=UPI00117B5590|nr:dipeptide epimerase [Fulvivirga sp. M361]TRX53012.1 dipeptide epimerase [Fulvivirga sp. M361]
MKIKEVRIYKKDLGNTRPYTIAFKTVDEVYNAFAEIELENGIVGLGSGNPSEYVVGESLTSTLSVLNNGKLDFLIHRDIRDLYSLLDEIQLQLPENPAARAALDIAVHDAFTKYIDVPLAVFLGQKIKSLPTSVTIGIKNVQDTLEEAKEYYEMGFRVLKVKTGKDVDEDIERMKKLRENYGNDLTIRVDANQGYDVALLTKFYKETESEKIELIEQPIPAKAVNELKALPEEIKRLVAADESLISPMDAFTLASPPAASRIFNIKLMKSGGIHPGRQIAVIAQSSGTELMWGCNDESAISISAALHAALGFSNTKYLDLDGSLDLVEDVVKGGFDIKDGWMSITSASGLGVSKIS